MGSFSNTSTDDNSGRIEKPAGVDDGACEFLGNALPDFYCDLIALSCSLGERRRCAFCDAFINVMLGVGLASVSGDLVVADVIFEGAEVAVSALSAQSNQSMSGQALLRRNEHLGACGHA